MGIYEWSLVIAAVWGIGCAWAVIQGLRL